jgi:hypothetical protein
MNWPQFCGRHQQIFDDENVSTDVVVTIGSWSTSGPVRAG